MVKSVKMAVIGVGSIGQSHLVRIDQTEGAEIGAVCDVDGKAAGKSGQEYGCEVFTDYRKLLKVGICDAVLIATPHFSHTTIGIAALKAGYHVLVEKPISVHKADCERLIDAHTNKKQVFAAMFNRRTDPHYSKVKQLIETGQLGEIRRISWIITDYFRTCAYYKSGSWRASWSGEGGGVLMNQCPHQLDLLQWLVGMPIRVWATCGFGKWHNIEVEDEATAYLEYRNGATGVFVTTTGESPGTNRLEIAAEMGKVVVENGRIQFTRNEIAMSKFSRTSEDIWCRPDVWHVEIPADGTGGQHMQIIQNFVDAILNGCKLIAPAEEGIKSVELANAMLYSSLVGKTVELPLDAKMFERKLKQLIRNSKTKTTRKGSIHN